MPPSGFAATAEIPNWSRPCIVRRRRIALEPPIRPLAGDCDQGRVNVGGRMRNRHARIERDQRAINREYDRTVGEHRRPRDTAAGEPSEGVAPDDVQIGIDLLDECRGRCERVGGRVSPDDDEVAIGGRDHRIGASPLPERARPEVPGQAKPTRSAQSRGAADAGRARCPVDVLDTSGAHLGSGVRGRVVDVSARVEQSASVGGRRSG